MGKKRINEKDLREQIYIICFNKPHYNDEVAEKIYSEDWKGHKSTISKKVKEMTEENWLEICDQNNLKLNYKPDKRKDYHFSLVTPLIDLIDEKVSLEGDEKDVLSAILDDDSFGPIIQFGDKCKNMDDVLKLIQTYAQSCQLIRNLSENKIIDQHKRMSPEEWKRLIKTSEAKEVTQNIDKQIEQKYEKYTPHTIRGKFTSEKFDKYITFRYEMIRLNNQTLNKLTKLVPIEKGTLDFFQHLSSTILDMQKKD